MCNQCSGTCGCACNVLDVTNITVETGSTFTLVVNPTSTVVNGRVYTLRLCQTLPIVNEQGNEEVTIQINGTDYPVLDKIGNILLAGRLRGNRRYRVVFGDNEPHFLMFDASCCMFYNPNPVVPTA